MHVPQFTKVYKRAERKVLCSKFINKSQQTASADDCFAPKIADLYYCAASNAEVIQVGWVMCYK